VRARIGKLAFVALLAALPASPATAQTIEPQYLEEMEVLTARQAVRDALARVEELDSWGMERLVELTEIPAPPFMEDVRAARFAELLREVGADSVWIDAEGNAVGLRRGRGGERTVAFGGHLDTVFPEGTDVTVRMRGDTLYAPGVGDDTRGLVVVLTVLRAMEEANVETTNDVLFIGTVGEEGLGDLRGMKYLFREEADPIDAWIEIDGGGLSRLVTQGLGSVRYRVTFTGPGGHSWGAFGLVNPAHALSRAVGFFQDAADALTRVGPRTSYNVGRIGGGASVNAIPSEVWMEVDMRSESPESLLGIERAFLEAMNRGLESENGLRREGPLLEVELDRIGDRPSGELPPSTPLIQRSLAASAEFDVTNTLARSSTNSNIPIALGIPAVTLGRGGVGGSGHAPGEWWINEDGHLAIQRALLVLVAEAGFAGVIP
jgi:acetylornithine deacetylase/succinyl-diaminopimelate desuccinylase-like protein